MIKKVSKHFDEKGVFQPCPFLCQSSNQDLIFLGQVSIGIKNNLQKNKRKFFVRKKTLKNTTKLQR